MEPWMIMLIKFAIAIPVYAVAIFLCLLFLSLGVWGSPVFGRWLDVLPIIFFWTVPFSLPVVFLGIIFAWSFTTCLIIVGIIWVAFIALGLTISIWEWLTTPKPKCESKGCKNELMKNPSGMDLIFCKEHWEQREKERESFRNNTKEIKTDERQVMGDWYSNFKKVNNEQ